MIVPQHLRVFLAVGTTDMRKSINGLCLMVQMHLELDPFAGHLFAFCNRRRNMVKILYWDRTVFVSGRSVWSGIGLSGPRVRPKCSASMAENCTGCWRDSISGSIVRTKRCIFL